jgi:hypothetical protein
MNPEGSLLSTASDEDEAQRYVAPTDRRPTFVAEGLSPAFRVGLLAATLLADSLLFAVVLTASIARAPLGLLGVLGPGALVTLGSALLLVYGALIGNNAQLGVAARLSWWAGLLLAGPVTLPCYWLMHVWPRPYTPPARDAVNPPA